MWAQIITVSTLTTLCLTQDVLRVPDSGITRTLNEGVISKGYELLRDDKTFADYNALRSEEEKTKKRNLKQEAIARLSPEDVSCFIYDDSFCSKNMMHLKNVLIQSVKGTCEQCTSKDKDDAANIASSIIYHDPLAWKLFLNRSGIQLISKA